MKLRKIIFIESIYKYLSKVILLPSQIFPVRLKQGCLPRKTAAKTYGTRFSKVRIESKIFKIKKVLKTKKKTTVIFSLFIYEYI